MKKTSIHTSPHTDLEWSSMTEAEYKDGGRGLIIRYTTRNTPFGIYCIAETDRGICAVHRVLGKKYPERSIREEWPNATIIKEGLQYADEVYTRISEGRAGSKKRLPVHVKGTPMQLMVWRALTTIPFGSVVTYTDIAKQIKKPTASRAVGSAIGANPIAILIPCHRVCRKDGGMGGYRWGITSKKTLLNYEQAATR